MAARGKKRGARPAAEVARTRELRAWRLRCDGWTLARIAADIGVTESAVSLMLSRTAAAYLADIKAQVEAMKVGQDAQLQRIVDEALQAWERSKLPAVTVTESVRPPADGQGSGSVHTETETAGQCGDVRYLQEARAALADIRKVWGLDAPERSEISGKDGQPLLPEKELTPPEKKAALAALLGVVP